jgi:DNA-binding response OmpR family regulator
MGGDSVKTANDRLRVVAVDDEVDLLAILNEWLSPKYEIICFSSPPGLDELADLEPDVILLDVRMPGSDGFSLCRRIRADRRLSSVPVLFLTACSGDEDFIENLNAGGTAYLAKPMGRRELLAKLEEVLTA